MLNELRKDKKLKRKKKNKINKKIVKNIVAIASCFILFILSLFYGEDVLNKVNPGEKASFGPNSAENVSTNTKKSENEFSDYKLEKNISNININNRPEYTGRIYVPINNNVPNFKEEELCTEPFEKYSELDKLGRCQVAYANICKELMPKKQREDIGDVKPSGWKQAKYDGEYLYNRCHLIGHQLAGENANELNLITGTRYFNVSGMLIFENKVAEYIDENPNNHVLYRIRPIFKENNLVASGVQMEGYSVEDSGKGVSFNVFVYNVQPGIKIDYATGKSSKE